MSEEWGRLVRVDLETGRLFWLPRGAEMFKDTAVLSAAERCAMWNGRYAGKEALTAVDRFGYRQGGLGGVRVKAHRVVFALVNGFLPPEIDHINRQPGDNRPQNLRAATRAGNVQNTKVAGGSSAYRGVQKRGSGWAAKIRHEGRQIHLGQFATEDAAAREYDRAAARLHGEFASLNFPRALQQLRDIAANVTEDA